jgi:hypothetical protein
VAFFFAQDLVCHAQRKFPVNGETHIQAVSGFARDKREESGLVVVTDLDPVAQMLEPVKPVVDYDPGVWQSPDAPDCQLGPYSLKLSLFVDVEIFSSLLQDLLDFLRVGRSMKQRRQLLKRCLRSA